MRARERDATIGRPYARPPLAVKRIIAAIDGSELARGALAYAAMIAGAADLEVVALHAIEPQERLGTSLRPGGGFPISRPGELGLETRPEMRRTMEQERVDAEATMSAAKAYCHARNISYTTSIVPGPLLSRLVAAAAPDDLIAIGRKGRFARSGLGSTAKWLIRHSPCPLLLVSGSLRPVNRILAVADGTTASRGAINVGRGLASQTGWPLTVAAVPGPRLTLDDSIERAEELVPGSQVIAFGAPGTEAERIEFAASRARHAILVARAYPDSWAHQLLFGGTTGHVLEHLDAPVILVR